MNKIFLIVFSLFLSCDTDITNTTSEDIYYNPEVSITKNKKNINIIIYDYPNISGFQFDLFQSENLNITSLESSGGLSTEYDFYIATSINNLRILGFSLTEAVIPSASQNSNILLQLDLKYEGFGELGITNVILSGENGTEIEAMTNNQTIIMP